MTVRELRDRIGLSQSKFAKHFGIPVINVQHWEQGVSKPPAYVIELLTRVLDLEDELSEIRKEC